MRRSIVLLSILGSSFCVAQGPAYRDPSLPVGQRVEDLLGRMRLDEQVAQLHGYFSRDTLAFDRDGNFVGVEDTSALNSGTGSFGSRLLFQGYSSIRKAQCINGIQRYMKEKTRLGIPVFVFGESLHGFMAQGATSFPQAIALGVVDRCDVSSPLGLPVSCKVLERGGNVIAVDKETPPLEPEYSGHPHARDEVGILAVTFLGPPPAGIPGQIENG